MTPAERARQIDKEEFAAECATVRQRAYARLDKPSPEAKVREWIKRTEPKRGIWREKMPTKRRTMSFAKANGSKARLYVAFNCTRTLKEWAKETGLSSNTIRNRLNLGWTIEQALTLAPHKGLRPGVSSDFPTPRETGGRGTSQETPNITFSGNDA